MNQEKSADGPVQECEDRSFLERVKALRGEGLELLPRLGGGSGPMILRDGDGRWVAVLVDREGHLWTFSERDGLICEEER